MSHMFQKEFYWSSSTHFIFQSNSWSYNTKLNYIFFILFCFLQLNNFIWIWFVMNWLKHISKTTNSIQEAINSLDLSFFSFLLSSPSCFLFYSNQINRLHFTIAHPQINTTTWDRSLKPKFVRQLSAYMMEQLSPPLLREIHVIRVCY